MAIRWTVVDPRGIHVFLFQDRWEHIVAGHPEIEEDWIRDAIESPFMIGTDPDPNRPPGERYVGRKLRGRATEKKYIGVAPVVPTVSSADESRTIKTAWVTTDVKVGGIVWTSPEAVAQGYSCDTLDSDDDEDEG